MYFDFIDVALIKVILFTQNLVMTYHYWISKLLWQKLWLVDTVFVKDSFPPVGQTCENLMNHLCQEKSQPTCPSSRRSEKDAIIARMKAYITKLLCPVRHVACAYAWRRRQTVFWSFVCSFPSRLHCFLYAFLRINYSCVDCLASFYQKYHVCLRILNSTKNA